MKLFQSRPMANIATLVLPLILLIGAVNANAEGQDKAQIKQEGSQAPQVRFGTPTKTISSDADQREYDQQDGGISGVTVLGSRVFESKGSNSAAKPPVGTNSNLIKHAGNAMPVTHIYAIYWGSGFPVLGYSSDVNSFLTGISGSPYNQVTTQYMPTSTANIMSFVSSFTDLTSPPTTAPSTSSILAEVYKVVVTTGKQTIDPQGLYMVFTNNFPSKANYCAWHGAGSVNRGAQFAVAYQPYLGTTAGCSARILAGYQPKTNIAVDAVANVASHEIYETVTDPLLNAWFDSAGLEIGDKCAWMSATLVAGYSVQTEWSNLLTGCKP
jgi:hypothetical protein